MENEKIISAQDLYLKFRKEWEEERKKFKNICITIAEHIINIRNIGVYTEDVDIIINSFKDTVNILCLSNIKDKDNLLDSICKYIKYTECNNINIETIMFLIKSIQCNITNASASHFEKQRENQERFLFQKI